MMENKKILEVLVTAVERYAGRVVRPEKNTVVVSLPGNQISYNKLKEAFVKAGEVLEENSESKAIIAIIPTGVQSAASAYAAAMIDNGALVIAVYFKEGLIKQGGAKLALDHIQKHLS